MGNAEQKALGQSLKNQKMLHCPSCQGPYDLHAKIPRMICSNQHNLCDQCLQEMRPKTCPECKQLLWIKKNKNALLVYILEKMQPTIQQQYRTNSSPFTTVEQVVKPQEHNSFATIESPSKKTIKVKSVRQQSTNNLGLELYKEEREFRKKYSVASIFAPAREAAEQQSKNKTKQETFEEVLQRYVQEYQIVPFKEIIQHKKEPESVVNLQLHLYKISKIFDFLPRFSNLVRLNLNKNRITTLENLSQLKALTYLSLSDNQLQRIQNLEGLSALKNLYLNKNRISRIQNLQALNNLEFLGLGYNAIPKIQGISHLLQLRWLNLEFNYLTKIQGLSALQNLQIILLGSNEIMVFEGFQNSPALRQIHLENNKIADLSKALSMKHLRRLRLEENPGLTTDSSHQYVKYLELIEAKSKGIAKNDDGCDIY